MNDNGDHYAVMFIDGHTLRRFMKRFSEDKFFTEVKISLNGKKLAHVNSHGENFAATIFQKEDEEESRKDRKARELYVPKKSSRGASFFVAEGVKVMEGALLTRRQTPWEWSRDSVLEQIDPAQSSND